MNRLRTSLSLQQPTGVWTNKFVYDAARRMTNLASPAGAFAYSLGASSPGSTLIKRLLLPNTAYITNTFDSLARLTGTFLANSGNTTLDSATYGYNQASQRTTFTNAAGTYVQYTYDNIGQLKVGTSSTSSENRGYLYDAAWNVNWRTNNGSTTSFTVDSKNQLSTVGGASYSYDGNGNLIWGTNSHNQYLYDDENRLVQWFYYSAGQQPVSGDLRTDFVYDGLGRLRSRSEYQYAGSGWLLSATTTYIYDGMRVIQERVGGTPTVSYTRGPDLSATMEGAGGIGGLLARSSGYSSGNWTTHYFYHADGSGNITYLVDGSQALAASYRYDPFGITTSSSGTQASASVYRFSSKEQHVSGLYIYLYRLYDPNSLRWINRDPLFDAGADRIRRLPVLGAASIRHATLSGIDLPLIEREFNLYSFVWNDPQDELDPLGLRGHPGRVNDPPPCAPYPACLYPTPRPLPPFPWNWRDYGGTICEWAAGCAFIGGVEGGPPGILPGALVGAGAGAVAYPIHQCYMWITTPQ